MDDYVFIRDPRNKINKYPQIWDDNRSMNGYYSTYSSVTYGIQLYIVTTDIDCYIPIL
jgi:hypothetical protein